MEWFLELFSKIPKKTGPPQTNGFKLRDSRSNRCCLAKTTATYFHDGMVLGNFFKKIPKNRGPPRSMVSIETAKKQPLLLGEDYRYLLSRWKGSWDLLKDTKKSRVPADQGFQLKYSRNNRCDLAKTTATYFHAGKVLENFLKLKRPPPPKINGLNRNLQESTTATWGRPPLLIYFLSWRWNGSWELLVNNKKKPTPADQWLQLKYSRNNHRYLWKTTATYFHDGMVLELFWRNLSLFSSRNNCHCLGKTTAWYCLFVLDPVKERCCVESQK